MGKNQNIFVGTRCIASVAQFIERNLYQPLQAVLDMISRDKSRTDAIHLVPTKFVYAQFMLESRTRRHTWAGSLDAHARHRRGSWGRGRGVVR